MDATSAKASYQNIFAQLLALQGKNARVGSRSKGIVSEGKIVYVMFDSFLLEVNGQRSVIPFEDIAFLEPLP